LIELHSVPGQAGSQDIELAVISQRVSGRRVSQLKVLSEAFEERWHVLVVCLGQ
jgi:hypothetical protein